MALIPLGAPTPQIPLDSGRPWWYLQHTDMTGDLSSFRLKNEHLLVAGAGLCRLPIALRQRLLTTVAELRDRLEKLQSLRAQGSGVVQAVTQALIDLEIVTDTLRNQVLFRWEVQQTARCLRRFCAPEPAPVLAMQLPAHAPDSTHTATDATPGPVPIVSAASAPWPASPTIGEVFDRIPHPSHGDYVLPPFAYTEDEDGGWPSVSWRQFWLWELREIEFRHELITLDLTLTQVHPDLDALQRIAPEQRFHSCKSCWGGSDLAPGCDDWGENDLCHADLRKRLRALGRFVSFMSTH
ncbi:hypothetical protein AURDEDRAFT_171066 [Auricularia subglabra TFB-10046 SS5]|nr:hypothetical protein AURDEDRAFT_171066 [Auricularia subglabra TFB-10046 SS5]